MTSVSVLHRRSDKRLLGVLFSQGLKGGLVLAALLLGLRLKVLPELLLGWGA
jgi:hypothetical protein